VTNLDHVSIVTYTSQNGKSAFNDSIDQSLSLFYWLWILGTRIEEVYGHAKTAMLIALLAVGSRSLDFAFDRGGVGSQEWAMVYSGFFVSYVTGTIGFAERLTRGQLNCS
jgi:hypothetical protein